MEKLFENTTLLPKDVEVIIVHSDCADGISAGTAALLNGFTGPIIGAGHYHPVDVAMIEGKKVLMCDVATTILVEQLKTHAQDFLILDHHRSSEKLLDTLPPNQFVYTRDYAGCELAWYYFNRADPIPRLMFHMAQRDRWCWNHPDTKAVTTAFFYSDFEMTSDAKADGLKLMTLVQGGDEMVETMKKDGEMLIEVMGKMASKIVGSRGEVLSLLVAPEVPITFLNVPMAYHDAIIDKCYVKGKTNVVAIINYSVVRNTWYVSLRSNDPTVKVDEIAQKLNGGGHAGAAAFRHVGDINDLLVKPATTLAN